jgi:hypothetical protein
VTVMDAPPPDRRDGRAELVSRRRLLRLAGGAGVVAVAAIHRLREAALQQPPRMALAVWLYFWLWHKVIHPIKYWKYRPKWVVVRQEGRPPMPMPLIARTAPLVRELPAWMPGRAGTDDGSSAGWGRSRLIATSSGGRGARGVFGAEVVTALRGGAVGSPVTVSGDRLHPRNVFAAVDVCLLDMHLHPQLGCRGGAVVNRAAVPRRDAAQRTSLEIATRWRCSWSWLQHARDRAIVWPRVMIRTPVHSGCARPSSEDSRKFPEAGRAASARADPGGAPAGARAKTREASDVLPSLSLS